MIFKPELAKLIPQGKKTMTRRPTKPGERECRYIVGRAYRVQHGRGKRGLYLITIQAVRDELLGALTIPDAKREGFRTRDDFYAYWQQLHGHIDLQQRVWVISFRVGDPIDAPRLLRARPSESGDYTSDPHLAMPDEPEAISAAQVESYSKISIARDDHLRRERLKEANQLVRNGVSQLRDQLGTDPDRELAKTVRGLERFAATLDRKLDPAA